MGRGAGTFAVDRSIGPLLGDHLVFKILYISVWYHDKPLLSFSCALYLIIFTLLFAYYLNLLLSILGQYLIRCHR